MDAAEATVGTGGVEPAVVLRRDAEVHGATPGVEVGLGGTEGPVGDEEGGDVVGVVVEGVLSLAVGKVSEHCGFCDRILGDEMAECGFSDLICKVAELRMA